VRKVQTSYTHSGPCKLMQDLFRARRWADGTNNLGVASFYNHF
jgi:hypothetical protein